MTSGILIDVDAGNIGLNAFAHQSFGPTIVNHLYAHNDDLGTIINTRIKLRTPVLTGALVSAEKYTANTMNPGSKDMVVFYASDSEQIAQWKRVYVAYQEGGSLGKPTYTNAPHEMYAKIQTDDIPLIEAWGEGYINEALDILASGTGIKP